MLNNSSAELREWAARCEDSAVSARNEKERASLLRKAEALRALADSEDWLAGQQTDRRTEQPESPVFVSQERSQAAK